MAYGAEHFGVFLRTLRVLGRIALWGTAVLLALLSMALAINAFDERPSPEALALREPPENRYGPDENIYVALTGFDAPPGQSVIATGQTKIARHNERVNSMLQDLLGGMQSPGATDPAALKFTGSVEFSPPREPAFWESVRASRHNIEQLAERNHELYGRYLALFELPGYYETARPSYGMPIYLAPTEIRTLFLARVSLGLQSADSRQTQAALDELGKDVDLWRRVLTGEGTLLSKMIAVSFLRTDAFVLADMIADSRTTLPPNMQESLPEFEANAWNIGSAFAAEFRLHRLLYQQAQALAENHWQAPDTPTAWRIWNRILSPLEGQFFKLNASENLDAKFMQELAEVAALDPSTFSTHQALLRKYERDNADLRSIRTVYNPVGKILISIAAPAYDDYALRSYDAAALQRLVRLSFEIRRQQVAPSAVAAFMKLHPEWSRHPADGRPFVWLPETNEIAIQPVAREPAKRRFSVRIWRQSAD